MRTKRIVKMLVIAAVAIPVFGFLVMSLWNWLMPAVFGVSQIHFWQALGLFFLSRILFGGFGGDGGRRHSHRRMMERWERMTPEERERFRAGMEGWAAQPKG
ncbi:MAG: hypothetical protein ACJ74H_14180 [Thermoanaerobaculia bacterium]